SERAMVNETLLAERPGPPAVHPGRGDGNPVHASAFGWNISAELVEAAAPEELAAARNMILALEAVPGGVVTTVLQERGAGDAEITDRGELRQQELEVVRLEGDVGVEIAEHLIVEPVHRVPRGVEAAGFRREVPVAVGRHIEALDPICGRRVP